MKFLSKEKSSFGIELTPLIDIVFLLVIFFVVTAKIQGNQYIDLELPTTNNFNQGEIIYDQIVYVFADNRVSISNKVLNINELESIFNTIDQIYSNERILVLAVEKRVFFENVVKIMDGLENLGFLNIKIQTYTHEQSIL
ncbi:MAG: biopolymer transporter ExbD [Gammaproteobacteria bacterium]